MIKKTLILNTLILSFSLTFNLYTDFGFALNSDMFLISWLLFYSVILPITLITCILTHNKTSVELSKISLITFVLYLISTLLSGINIIDFEKFVILGDGATKYIITAFFVICFIVSLLSFFLFQLRIKK